MIVNLINNNCKCQSFYVSGKINDFFPFQGCSFVQWQIKIKYFSRLNNSKYKYNKYYLLPDRPVLGTNDGPM